MYGEAIILFIIFGSLTTIAIIFGLLIYFGKRLEHKEILAAIEKGTPLSELKPDKKQQNGSLWIKNLTFGVAMMIIGIALIFVGSHTIGSPGGRFLAFVFFGIGVAWIIRGLLFRKYQEKNRLSANGSASTPEISQQPNE